MAADASLLDMFSFDFVYGNKNSALSELSSVVLTQSAAKAIFGDVNPVGQVIKFNSQFPLKVSAVIKDNPGKFFPSVLRPSFLMGIAGHS